METILNDEHLDKLAQRAWKCKQEDGGPEITTNYYAARKVKGVWKISNGRTWWDNPSMVREIHEYPDGTVTMHQYIEGVGLFGRRSIENAGMKAVRPSELHNFMPVTRVVYFDHRKLDDRGRAARLVREMEVPR